MLVIRKNPVVSPKAFATGSKMNAALLNLKVVILLTLQEVSEVIRV